MICSMFGLILVSHPYIPPALLQIFPFSFPILLIHASKFLFSIPSFWNLFPFIMRKLLLILQSPAQILPSNITLKIRPCAPQQSRSFKKYFLMPGTKTSEKTLYSCPRGAHLSPWGRPILYLFVISQI